MPKELNAGTNIFADKDLTNLSLNGGDLIYESTERGIFPQGLNNWLEVGITDKKCIVEVIEGAKLARP